MLEIFNRHYTLKRNSRIRLYTVGGVADDLVDTPVDITLDKLPESEFNRVATIVDLLQKQKQDLEYDEGVADYGYYLELGKSQQSYKKMKKVFNGGAFSRTPLVLYELDTILKRYAGSEDLELKP